MPAKELESLAWDIWRAQREAEEAFSHRAGVEQRALASEAQLSPFQGPL